MSERDKWELKRFALNNRDVTVDLRKIDSPSFHKLHWHSYIEIELCVKGKAIHDLNGTEYNIGKGDVYILRPSDFHSIKATQNLELYNISTFETALSNETLTRLARFPKEICTVLKDETFECAEGLAYLMLKESSSSCRSDAVLQKLLDCFILKVLESIPSLGRISESMTDPISAAVTYINMHFLDDPSLAEAAAAAHYNPSHFSTKFRETIGTTYSEYLSGLKINYAKKLLLSTDLKISDIAFKSGFTSQSHFLRMFGKAVGTSPLKFRTKHRENVL